MKKRVTEERGTSDHEELITQHFLPVMAELTGWFSNRSNRPLQ